MTTALAEKQAQIIQWSRDEVATIRDTVAKSATENELKMFLHLSQTYGLDPFAKEIWFIKAGGQPVIISAIFTVPMHRLALYHHSPNSQ